MMAKENIAEVFNKWFLSFLELAYVLNIWFKKILNYLNQTIIWIKSIKLNSMI